VIRIEAEAGMIGRAISSIRTATQATVGSLLNGGRKIGRCVLIVLAFSSVVSAAESDTRTDLTPEIAVQSGAYLPQFQRFVASNVAQLRSGPLLRSDPIFGLSLLKGVSPKELAATKRNLAAFGVDPTPSGAKPNFFFITPASPDDVRQMLVNLGIPKDLAGIQWSIYLSSVDSCYLTTLDATGEVAVAVARADSNSPKPAVCLNNTVLNALGLYKSFEQFTPVAPSSLTRWVNTDFVGRVTRCKRVLKVADAIADCVMASYAFPK
jgi:hypothetical protein